MKKLEFIPRLKNNGGIEYWVCDVGFWEYRIYAESGNYSVYYDYSPREYKIIFLRLPTYKEAESKANEHFEERMSVAIKFRPIKHPVLGVDIKIKTDCVDDLQQALCEGHGFGLATAVSWYKANNK